MHCRLSIVLGFFLPPAVPVNSVGQNKLGLALNETLIQLWWRLTKDVAHSLCLFWEKHFNQHISPSPPFLPWGFQEGLVPLSFKCPEGLIFSSSLFVCALPKSQHTPEGKGAVKHNYLILCDRKKLSGRLGSLYLHMGCEVKEIWLAFLFSLVMIPAICIILIPY